MTQNKSINHNLKTKNLTNTSYKVDYNNSSDLDNNLDYSIILQKMPTDLLIHIISYFLTPLNIDAFIVTSSYNYKLRVPIWNNCANIYFIPNLIKSNSDELITRDNVWKHWQKQLIISATLDDNKVDIMNNSRQWWNPNKPCVSSKFSTVAYCIQVCWFDISFEKNITCAGRFKVYLRVQHIYRDSCLSKFNVSATKLIKDTYMSNEKIVSQYDPQKDNNWNLVNCNGWINIYIGTIKIVNPNTIVRVRMWKHDSDWVRDISVDFAFLVEIL